MGNLKYTSMFTRPVNPDFTGMFKDSIDYKNFLSNMGNPARKDAQRRVQEYADTMDRMEAEAYKNHPKDIPTNHMPLTWQQAYDDAMQMEAELGSELVPTHKRKVFATPGNINSADMRVRDYSLPGLFYAAPNSGPLYMDDGLGNGRGNRILVKRDLSNADANGAYYGNMNALQSQKIWEGQDGVLALPPVVGDRLSNMKASRVAGNIASSRNMQSALTDWMSYLDRDNWANSYYGQQTNPLTKQKDAKIIKAAYEKAGGDIQTAFRLALGSEALSAYGEKALGSLVGYFNPSNIEMGERLNLRMNDIARFFNATRDAENLASQYYTFDDSRATYSPKFYDPEDPDNSKGDPNGISYDDYMRQSAANDLRLSDRAKAAISQNQYAHGGHLRTPNTIRSRNGLKMRRADDLGSADYDIYF